MRDINLLVEQATKIRKDIVQMICKSKSGHPGGSLSAADIVTALYFSEMNIDPKNP
ncbi:MAG: transketolase, partial [Cetobacterium sp.]